MNSMTVLDYCEKYLYKMIAKKTGGAASEGISYWGSEFEQIGGEAIWI